MSDSTRKFTLPASQGRQTRAQRRLTKSSAAVALDPPDQITYQHSVLCQVSMPYRNQGMDTRTWERVQGRNSLRLEAGAIHNPETGQWVEQGLPFGAKPRLILAHLNAEALKSGSPTVEVEKSLTAFTRKILKRNPTGPEIRTFKDQIGRLSTATIRIALTANERAVQVDSKIVSDFDMWFPKDGSQRALWPSMLHLSLDYFASLQKHAVPLDERTLAALSHSAMALDIYGWLAQRLHRVPKGRPQFITWAALKDQFGQDYVRIQDFKRKFLAALEIVLTHYPTAKIKGDKGGLTLRNSPPPVSKRLTLISPSSKHC